MIDYKKLDNDNKSYLNAIQTYFGLSKFAQPLLIFSIVGGFGP